MKLNKLVVLALSISVIFTSCSDDDNETALPKGDYDNGIIISHEGNFGQGNASISFVPYNLDTVENNVFSSVNGLPLGDTAQSMAFYNDLAYIIVNNSDKIEVVNRYTFESVATITGMDNPRYMAISNGKGYVTSWGDYSDTTDDSLLVINLETNTISDTISTSYLPEEIISSGDKVFVATGIYGNGDKVDVINTNTDELQESITVGNSPNSLQLDSDGDLWVLSSDNLIEINTSSNEVTKTLNLDSSISSPSNLSFDNGSFYFYAGGSVYKINETATTFPTTSEFSGVNFYDMSVKNGFLYGLDAGDFSSNGTLKVYDLNTNTEAKSITINIVPGGIYFN